MALRTLINGYAEPSRKRGYIQANTEDKTAHIRGADFYNKYDERRGARAERKNQANTPLASSQSNPPFTHLPAVEQPHHHLPDSASLEVVHLYR